MEVNNMPTTFTLLRHGPVAGSPALYGHTDVSLSEQGHIAMCSAIDVIHSHLQIDHIVSSPLVRCSRAAQLFAQQNNVPIAIVSDLKEMNFGDWDGIPFDQLADEWKNLEAFWQSPSTIQPPNGELLEAFATRIIRAWETLLASSKPQHYLVACHGGAIRIIVAHLLNIDWRNANLFTQLHISYNSSTRIEIGDFENSAPIIKWIGCV